MGTRYKVTHKVYDEGGDTKWREANFSRLTCDSSSPPITLNSPPETKPSPAKIYTSIYIYTYTYTLYGISSIVYYIYYGYT